MDNLSSSEECYRHDVISTCLKAAMAETIARSESDDWPIHTRFRYNLNSRSEMVPGVKV